MAEQELSTSPGAVERHPISVGRLIALLSQLPEEAMVLVTGYEGDMTLAVEPEFARVERSTAYEGGDVPWYYGDWVRSDGADAVQAVYIGGERHDA